MRALTRTHSFEKGVPKKQKMKNRKQKEIYKMILQKEIFFCVFKFISVSAFFGRKNFEKTQKKFMLLKNRKKFSKQKVWSKKFESFSNMMKLKNN